MHHHHANGRSITPSTAAVALDPRTADRDDFILFEDGHHALRHPWAALAFIVVSTLDIVFTWVILSLGGVEVNPIANAVIVTWGLPGAIAFKYSLMLLVIVIFEAVGRHRARAGRMLSLAAIGISAIPVVWSTFLLTAHYAAFGG